MESPRSLSKMEVRAMMTALGYNKSLLPRHDVDIYLRNEHRIPIDFADDWDVPYSDFIEVLRVHGISEDDVVKVYGDLYSDAV